MNGAQSIRMENQIESSVLMERCYSGSERCLKYPAGVLVAELGAACWKLLQIEISAARGVTVSGRGARRAGPGHGESGGGEYKLGPLTAVGVI